MTGLEWIEFSGIFLVCWALSQVFAAIATTWLNGKFSKNRSRS